ncbi:hypothetical protein [Pseudomonas gingeri]|uniref:hypothetical protein n=1 Tax=Pseudomonas gingeri TaxID=117681 RepID=UPI0015C16F46|nr:hypothetical protein [Pseudomonas gingeri]NWD49006.1 hypothetical protein [Pseudomonas gingeri]
MIYYAYPGRNVQVSDDTDGLYTPEEGMIVMQYSRPDNDDTLLYTAALDGTWVITEETLRAKKIPVELEWQATEMSFIANQLLAIEEEADDALPGTRKQWLSYRTLVRLWHESADFPDQSKRPIRPA